MTEREQLLEQLQDAFTKTKKRLGFQATFEDIDATFYLKDLVLSERFVSEIFAAQLRNRMIDLFSSWVGVLHSWLMPQPQDLIFLNEAKKLNEEEKKEIFALFKHIMYFVRKNKRIAFEKNEQEEGLFIDELMSFAKEKFEKSMLKLQRKFENHWKEE